MRREKEFVDYLIRTCPSVSKATGYVGYCNAIEGKYGGKDMDAIVAIVGDNLSALDAQLKKTLGNEETRKKYALAYSHYNEFYKASATASPSTPSSWVPSVACGGDAETAHVKYESSVFPTEQPKGLCQFIEDVYPDVIAYAENLLGNVPLKGVRPIPVFLSKEKPIETYLPDVDDVTKAVCRGCESFCRWCDGHPFDVRENCEKCREGDGCDMCGRYGTIREILQSYGRDIKHSVSGRFFADPEPHIVLYFRHFDTATFWESAANVLAHEYLHYLHYSYANTKTKDHHKHTKTNDRHNKQKKLSEALADFFCVQYSLHRGDNDIAQRKYNAWQKRQNTTWPYWWALRFLPQPYRRHITDYTEHDWIQKYFLVFKESTDSDRAFQLLKED